MKPSGVSRRHKRPRLIFHFQMWPWLGQTVNAGPRARTEAESLKSLLREMLKSIGCWKGHSQLGLLCLTLFFFCPQWSVQRWFNSAHWNSPFIQHPHGGKCVIHPVLTAFGKGQRLLLCAFLVTSACVQSDKNCVSSEDGTNTWEKNQCPLWHLQRYLQSGASKM